MSRKFLAFLILLLGLRASYSAAATPSPQKHDAPWWQHAVFYEIYPRSFLDSNNDGIGDLRGITSKLGYLKDLGIDAVWLTPCYPSPQVDFGYDVSDYENIDPVYGTLKDFDELEREAKKKGIRIIMDLVLNHTSDQHKWFVDSRSSRTSAHRDWYIWRDGGGPGQLPNNWESIFGGSAWKFDPATSQYYYHRFYPEQPDLNWRNPAVEKAMFDVTRWWYTRGVAGFRLDAVSNLFEDPALHNNPLLPGVNNFGDPKMEDRYNDNLPEVHGVLRDLRKVADEHDAVLIGETWAGTASELKQYYGNHEPELQMPMDLAFTKIPTLSAPAFREHIAALESAGGWPVYVISNHDIVRSYVRYGDGQHNDAIAKLMAGLYLTLRGTPIMYYGEEIGMQNNDPLRKEDVKDPIGKVGWPREKGRDGERTPMQWDDGPSAGFTRGTPWLPVAPSFKTHNVAAELKDPHSILNFYKRLLALRRNNAALLDGDYVSMIPDDPHVLSYLRRTASQSVLVVLNMSGTHQTVTFDLSLQGLASAKSHTLLSTMHTNEEPDLAHFSLEPFAIYIGEVVQ
jgi:alpha-glucosidase